MKKLIPALRSKGVKIGIATSVVNPFLEQAKIYPSREGSYYKLSPDQIKWLKMFKDQEQPEPSIH
jgi:hypothetical protein